MGLYEKKSHILIAGIDVDADVNKNLDLADWNMFLFYSGYGLIKL